MAKRVVILGLVSGGVDSTTAALHAKHEYCGEGVECYAYALTLSYGQRHSREIESARRFAERYGFKHLVVEIRGLSGSEVIGLGVSALTDKSIEVPETLEPGKVPVTYVPQRNLVLLAHAASILEMLLVAHDAELGVLSVGFHRSDWSMDEPVYPDTRREFVDALELAVNLGSGRVFEGKSLVRIHAPFVDKPKWFIIRWGVEHGMDYSLTWSCYRGGEKPCGRCPACKSRLRAFMAAGVEDPLTPLYETLPDWYKEWLENRERCSKGDRSACKVAEELSARERRR
ncbi:exsB protein [Pyrolobus fumarii 1A]|uniref:7-cyano-7-deazaguanine synthase n=1 Tax=Pyrolobus fumarii (strain DSM 11204 / 1A) TaxID=694429 RepID=G0EE27_PYRF1|nr:7-cyano-7-deazaguanine synthase [Pyrolobus fumarii]AEM37943.1 exsB protein [Pyrolobus fumarii 1A]